VRTVPLALGLLVLNTFSQLTLLSDILPALDDRSKVVFGELLGGLA
jgi:hypothetical protein